MDLIYEENIIRFQVGEQGRQIARSFQYRAGGLAQSHVHFIGNDVRQGGFAQTRRAEDQDVIQWFLAFTGGTDEDLHLFMDGWLAYIVSESFGAQ